MASEISVNVAVHTVLSELNDTEGFSCWRPLGFDRFRYSYQSQRVATLVQTGSLELTGLAVTNLSGLLECDRWKVGLQVLPSPHKYFQRAPYQVDRCDKSKEFGKCSICHGSLTVVMANRI